MSEEETNPRGLVIERYFSRERPPRPRYFTASLRQAKIVAADGTVIFEQEVMAPVTWSDLAVRITAQKYFRGKNGTTDRESSVYDLVKRVVSTIRQWGLDDGYFKSRFDAVEETNASIFEAELEALLLGQYVAFNSPVWFNVGVEEHPQCSACFIQSVDDHMESILELAKSEGMLFKYGSGTGSNLSAIRGREEGLENGGTASGPVSFMKGYDAFAGVIKSGGKTRRAAKMVILDVDHPDVEEYIDSKYLEEEKARALVAAGYEGGIDGEAYASVFFQNANHSVRVPDSFMEAARQGLRWDLISRRTGETMKTVDAQDLLHRIAVVAHSCGDPGLQFDTAINAWHTCPVGGRINASNPCSEYMFLDDSACNLASLNLRKFQNGDGTLNVEAFKRAVRIIFIAQEILVDRASYPTESIRKNSVEYRPIGLGYANLGAFLMVAGLPYDSKSGRATASAITALMQAEASLTSALLAQLKGPFERYAENAGTYMRVMERHADAIRSPSLEAPNVAAVETWKEALHVGRGNGWRNAQLSVLAPTGTIAFMMDCDTTGVEPDIALRKTKTLVGGGSETYVNASVRAALLTLCYGVKEIDEIEGHIQKTGGVEGCWAIKDEDLPVFDCAFPPAPGGRSISWQGHVKMMAAVQPFLSGAISKTVNLPADATVDDVLEVYTRAWSLGLKSIAVYRDGSKEFQPLTASSADAEALVVARARPAREHPEGHSAGREKLGRTRASLTHRFDIGGHKGYFTIGLYPDRTVGEMFIRMAKEGSTISGLMDAVATSVSIALQYGVPLPVLIMKFARTRFEPSGFSGTELGYASSVLDYIFRWLEANAPHGVVEMESILNLLGEEQREQTPVADVADVQRALHFQDSGPPCGNCGAIMEPNGACHRCPNCGGTSGCS